MQLQKVALIGVGLLGGSIGLALRQRRAAREVHGFVRRAEAAAECAALRVVDEVTTDLRQSIRDADFVILCTPIAQMTDLTKRMLPDLKPGAIVTDVGSVKAGVVQALEPLVSGGGGNFIGSHPMAGGEKTGANAAKADLFKNAICIVTPSPTSDRIAVERVENFWRLLGGRPIRLTPETHDELVSRSSHLPHVVAAALARYVLAPAGAKAQSSVCATGFGDMTRIASGSPEMWRDIALANRANLADALGGFIEDLKEFQLALELNNAVALAEFFETGKLRRDNWLGNGGTSSE